MEYFWGFFALFFYVSFVVDRNLGDWLYIKLVLEPGVRVGMGLFRFRLWTGLKYDRFCMRVGYIRPKYRKMAQEIRKGL